MGLNVWDSLTGADRELYEHLAAIEHQRWADWQNYVHGTCGVRRDDGSIVIPAGTVARWERQIAASYGELSEQERDSDRAQVARYWPLLITGGTIRRGRPGAGPGKRRVEDTMDIDLYETAIADTSHAFNVLLTTVQAITPEPVALDPELGTASITRVDGVTVRVALTYDDWGLYTGVQIDTIPSESTRASWVVWCAMNDLPRLLPATLTGDPS